MVREKIIKKSGILKVIAHPVRLRILHKLMEDSYNVGEINTYLESPQSTISQHLTRLKAAGIIQGERNGNQIYYKLINKDVKEIVDILVRE